jgi:hypothetical protein
MRVICNSGSFSFVLVRTVRSCVHVIRIPNQLTSIAKLKIVIPTDFETKSKSKPLTVPFYGNPLNSARGCIQMIVIIVVITENVCMSGRWKAEQVAYVIHKPPSPCFSLLMPSNSRNSLTYQFCLEKFSTLFCLQKPIATKPFFG